MIALQRPSLAQRREPCRRVFQMKAEIMNDVTIAYCKPCGYEKRAKEAADALNANLAVTARLVPGKGGIFEVRVNAEIVAKRVKGHFPDIDEIVESVSTAVK